MMRDIPRTKHNLPLKRAIPLADLLDGIRQIRYRVEQQPTQATTLKTFVGVIDFPALSTPNAQVVFGRNGAGKTHLLKAYREYCEASFSDTKLIPIYIDFRALQFDPVMRAVSADVLIRRFYQYFVRATIEQLTGFANSFVTVPTLQKIFGGDQHDRKAKIEESLSKLDALVNVERIDTLLKEYVKKVEHQREGSSSISADFGVSASLSLKAPGAGIKAGTTTTDQESERQKESVEVVYNGLAVIDYHSIMREIENIAAQCGSRAVVVLIDEWSAVNLNLQPLLAEMIRKTLVSSTKIHLKIAALKYFTRLSAVVDAPQRIGYQVGIDITELADLGARPSNRHDSHARSPCAPTIAVAARGDGRVGARYALAGEERITAPLTCRGGTA